MQCGGLVIACFTP
ncbi:DUF3265 domain-containing protein [Vibrio parahaemolyticus]|nr:DUF3265 domain-containing protein [Vibrio parahaemolyticus]MCL1717041.1 DUF3265 domain-containing protein [Vibrio parahaemolyticus]MCL1721614.1 DUF3265 domain-containing protein [Vibrio parahaemolyticus]MCL1726282.1 DUF3265 domain-containing protein [Vibrio parahaemolyticus]MCL1730732.1 DUF3265 domain-containing protein [Vibrio parahaemolyticus]